MRAHLILDSGDVFSGEGFGAGGEAVCPISFNTSMSGYVAHMTDQASYKRAIVFAYPIIGGFGVCYEDYESDGVAAGAIICHRLSDIASNFRSDGTLQSVLEHAGIPGIEGIDTRALVRILRNRGVMKAMLTRDEAKTRGTGLDGALREIRAFVPPEPPPQPVREYNPEGSFRLSLLDLGARRSFISRLCQGGAYVKAFGRDAKADDLLSFKPDGLLIAGGADGGFDGELISVARRMLDSGLPLLAVGAGHLLLAQAAGAAVIESASGAQGDNCPVRRLSDGKCFIVAQGGGRAVDRASLNAGMAAATYEAVNGKAVFGLEYGTGAAWSYQFYPGLSFPGGTGFILDAFLDKAGGNTYAQR